jgi:hypothetical protein
MIVRKVGALMAVTVLAGAAPGERPPLRVKVDNGTTSSQRSSARSARDLPRGLNTSIGNDADPARASAAGRREAGREARFGPPLSDRVAAFRVPGLEIAWSGNEIPGLAWGVLQVAVRRGGFTVAARDAAGIRGTAQTGARARTSLDRPERGAAVPLPQRDAHPGMRAL